MAPDRTPCAQCGSTLASDSEACPVCGAPVDPRPSEPTPAPPPSGEPSATGGELARRRARLRQWQEQAEPLGVRVAQFPPWAEVAAEAGPDPDGWLEVMRGVERLAQRNVVAALEQWERQTKSRLARLEAYSVDGRLERDQMDDVLHAARTGEVSQALTTYQQVDRVVTLKERHLDQARDELERLVSLFRDMQALGLDPPIDPGELADDLERELRSGRLAPLKQQLRALRLQATNRLKDAVPGYISRYGEFLVRERSEGTAVEVEAAELARGAKAFVDGHPEEALRRLRILAQVHGGRSGAAGPAAPKVDVTGASRTA
ncbi:MAG TPA: zinc ribbon domain-containing protein [Thermoplasmata archaeon]|nr:zinc ribbon domain-containing protein [Thermoplasmata archaeon]